MSAGGGARIGTRGPGETQLEIDRRRIIRRIHKLEADLRDIQRHRDTQRKAAQPQPAAARSPSSATPTPASPRCSTGSPTPACSSRTGCSPPSTPPPAASQLPGGEAVLLTDTVGFVRKLPHQLVEAFKSHPRGGGRRRPAGPRGRRLGARPAGQHRRGARRAARDRRRRRARAARASTRPTSTPRRPRASPSATRARSPSRPCTGEGIDDAARDDRRPRSGRMQPVVELLDPLRPGRRARRGPPRGRGARRDPRRRQAPRVRARLDAGVARPVRRRSRSRSRP